MTPLTPWAGRSRRHVATVAAVVLVCLVAAVWSGQQWEPRGGTQLRARRVVVFGFPGVTFADVTNGRVPNLASLAERGGRAALNVRTGSRLPSTAEAYATIGASSRVKAAPQDALVFDVSAPVANVTGADALALRTGARPSRGVVALGAAHLRRTAQSQHLSTKPGALGQALHDARDTTAMVGDGPAALAAMDASGVVDHGMVAADLSATDDTLLAEVDLAVATSDFVVVGAPDARTSPAIVAGDDALLGAVARRLPPETLLLVVGVAPPTTTWELTPLVAIGPGVDGGVLSSSETKRSGLVTLASVAPTVLGAIGAPAPAALSDAVLQFHRGGPSMADLATLNRDAVYRERVYYPITIWYIVLQVLAVYVAATIAAGIARRHDTTLPRTARWLRPLALATAAFPLCTYLWRAIPGMSRLGWTGAVVLVAVTAAVTALVSLDRRHPLAPLAWLLGATVALLLADTATGARLEPASILGYSPHTSSRFFGLGNTAMAVLASAVLLLAAIWIDRAGADDQARTRAFVDVAGLFAVAFFVAAAPTLGSKVGAFLTLLPVFAAALWHFSGRRITWRVVPVVGVLVAAAVGVAGALDALRSSASRTHLGALFRETSSGGGTPLRLVIARKLEVTVRMTLRSQFTAVIPLIAVFFLFLLLYERRYERMLPYASALRAGIVAALAAGLLGTFVNDSGSVVVALAFVYVGPLATLLVCERIATGEWP